MGSLSVGKADLEQETAGGGLSDCTELAGSQGSARGTHAGQEVVGIRIPDDRWQRDEPRIWRTRTVSGCFILGCYDVSASSCSTRSTRSFISCATRNCLIWL